MTKAARKSAPATRVVRVHANKEFLQLVLAHVELPKSKAYSDGTYLHRLHNLSWILVPSHAFWMTLRSFVSNFAGRLRTKIAQSFLDIGSVSRILDDIKKLCWQFCWRVENRENKQTTTELEHIAELLQGLRRDLQVSH
ncbi:gamma-tubulin complex component [Striga asiatica]|uniref:Gamma-tubulin complex component n=1 Tax=Striga asiatica TaxID=4170 RepID=A0A5A7PKR5_STRAF|nr:gamma-tubulin complex component [Striga asiatica]